MISTFKKSAVAVSTAMLALATPNMAVAQSSMPMISPQEITVDWFLFGYEIEITVCVAEDIC